MQRQLTQNHALVDVRRRYRLEGVLVVLLEQRLLDFQRDLHRFQRILELPVQLVDAAQVVEAQHPQLQHFLRWLHQCPYWLEHENVDALRDEVELFAELHRRVVHYADVELLHEGGELVEDVQAARKLLFTFGGHRGQVDQPLLYEVRRELLWLCQQILVVLLQQHQRLAQVLR